jgi:hypothetical protein
MGINTHTVWALNEPRRIDIADEVCLRLFSIEKESNLIDFPSADLTRGRGSACKDLSDYLDKELIITVYCETHSPTPCIKKIRDIIETSKSE